MVIEEVIVAWMILKEHFAADELFTSHFKNPQHTHKERETASFRYFFQKALERSPV